MRLFRYGGGTRAGFTRSCSNEVVSDSTDDGFIVIKAEHHEKELYPPPPSDLASSIPSGT